MSFFLVITFSTLRRRLQEIKDAADKSDEINLKMLPHITECQTFIDKKRQLIGNPLNDKINSFLEEKFSTITFTDLFGKTLNFSLVDLYLGYIITLINRIMGEIENFKEDITKEIKEKNGKPAFQKNIDELFQELTRADDIRLIIIEFKSKIMEAQIQICHI